LRDKVGFTFLVGGDMERRRLAGMKPVSLSHLFFENLSEKTRFWVIVVRKFYRVVALTDEITCRLAV
jgi:hypothetical protein